MAAADLLCKFTNLFGGLTDLRHRRAQAMADTQRRQSKYHHHSCFHHQEDVHRLGVIPVMVLKRVQQNGAKNGRAKAQRGLLQGA
jgi:hypothetical protein